MENQEDTKGNSESSQATILPNDQSLPKISGMMRELEMMIMEKSKSSSGIDLGSLSESQKDKVIETLSKHEDNAYNVYMKRLEVGKDLKTKEINASIVNQKTNRYVYIGSLTAFFLITLLILFFKDGYLGQWLAFVTGLVGGFGLSKIDSKPKTSSKNPLDEIDENE